MKIENSKSRDIVKIMNNDDLYYRGVLRRDILDLLNYVDHQDGPAAVRGASPFLEASYDNLVSVAEVAAEALRDEHPNAYMERARGRLAHAVAEYRHYMSDAGRRGRSGYESDY